MNRKLYLMLAMLCISFTAWSQTRQITGQITKENSTENVAAVSVTVKGTSIAASSDATGKYTINVPDRPDVVLEFSSIGYRTQNINVGNRSIVNVSLTE